MKLFLISLNVLVLLLLGFLTVRAYNAPDIEGAGDGGRIWLGYMGNNGTDVKRFVDKDYGLVCWVMGSHRGGGISCLKVEDKR